MWMNRFSWLTVASTLLLLVIGGQVTSKEAGMAVPDWPTTYGYNMFLFPLSRMVDGVFWEHLHRLVASGVGLLACVLAVWIQLREKRSWVKTLAWVALGSVILQGVLGGLRVVFVMNQIGIVHAALAQTFLAMLVVIACGTSSWWGKFQRSESVSQAAEKIFNRWMILLSVVVFLQLLLGATMRHAHSGLAVPDFPLSYGKAIPDLSEETLASINEWRSQNHLMPTTAHQIGIHLSHRFFAFILLGLFVGSWLQISKRFSWEEWEKRISFTLLSLIILQVMLGVLTIWTGRLAEMATMHMIVGAVIFCTCIVSIVRSSQTSGQTISVNQVAVPSNSPGALAV